MNTHSMLQIKFSVLNVLGIFCSSMQNDSTLEMFGVIYGTIVSKSVSIYLTAFISPACKVGSLTERVQSQADVERCCVPGESDDDERWDQS